MEPSARGSGDGAGRGGASGDILEAEERIAQNAYVLQIYQYPLRWEAWWNYVHGYHPLAANIRSYVRTTWVDK